MDSLLDRMFDDLKISLHREFLSYIYYVKVSEVRQSFYVLIKKREEKS